MTPQVVITVNGPGEVAGWVYPVVRALKDVDPSLRVVVISLPCVFATGAEASVARGLPGVDGACGPAASIRFVLRGIWPPCLEPGRPGCVLHLGGEPLLSLALARRLGYPAIAYSERAARFPRRFAQVFLRDAAAGPVRRGRGVPIGDLVVDAARLRCVERAPRNAGRRLAIGLFAGSREQIFRHTLPFFVRAAGLAERRLPGTRWMIARSDFVDDGRIAAVMLDSGDRALEGDNARPVAPGRPLVLVSDRGLRLETVPLATALAEIDLAVTIPGTANGELAALGIPMLTTAPFGRLRSVPLPGLLGHAERVPIVGGALKAAAVYAYSRRHPLLSYPNRRAGRAVAPEMRGSIGATEVADALATLAAADRDAIGRDLREVMGPSGAAMRLAAEIAAIARTRI